MHPQTNGNLIEQSCNKWYRDARGPYMSDSTNNNVKYEGSNGIEQQQGKRNGNKIMW